MDAWNPEDMSSDGSLRDQVCLEDNSLLLLLSAEVDCTEHTWASLLKVQSHWGAKTMWRRIQPCDHNENSQRREFYIFCSQDSGKNPILPPEKVENTPCRSQLCHSEQRELFQESCGLMRELPPMNLGEKDVSKDGIFDMGWYPKIEGREKVCLEGSGSCHFPNTRTQACAECHF